MKELWENILSFLTKEVTKIGNFSILWWYIIVAAVALVALLLIITISVAVSKKKKKKANAEKQNKSTESLHEKKNKSQSQSFNDIAPDWQPVAVAPKKGKKAAKKAVEQPAPQVEPEQPVVEEPVAQETIEQPISQPEPEQPIVEKPVVEEKPAEIIKPAPQAVTFVEPVKKQDIAVAEKVQPVRNTVEFVAPKQAEPVQKINQVEEPVTAVEPFVEEPVVEEKVEQATVEEPVVEEKETIAPQPQVAKQTPIATKTTAEQEAVATTAPRALPKKTNKTTKKTADQIAKDIEEKTGTNPRKKSEKPAVVGQDKLPKKASKAKKNEVAQAANTNTATSDELPLITTDPTVETFGKFVIIKNDDNSARPYHFRLLANNGQILFESESYKSKPKSNSIIAFKKAAANEDNFEKDVDKAGNWRYKLYNQQHTVIGVGESYSTKQGCENSVQSVIKFAESARFLEDQSED